MKSINVIILALIASFLSACAIQKSPAPIEYGRGSKNVEDADSDYKIKSVEDSGIKPVVLDSDLDKELSELQSENLSHKEQKTEPVQQQDKIINHTVKPGETIEDIAAAYGQNIEDIAALNELDQPYHIEESEIIRVRVSKNADRDSKEALDSLKAKKAENESRPAAAFIKPVNGKIENKFGAKTANGINKGISIASPEGEEVLASASGKVIYADYDATFGNLIIIKVDNKNIVTSYAHLSNIIVDKGARVAQGDVIGHVGKTGKVASPQLHFAIREGKVAKDPEAFVKY